MLIMLRSIVKNETSPKKSPEDSSSATRKSAGAVNNTVTIRKTGGSSNLIPTVILGLTVVASLCVSVVQTVTIEKFLTLTLSEKVALDKLKDKVASKLPKDYMRQDAYLIMWVRAANRDPDTAERLILENLQWRHERKMDTIHSEDWSDMRALYPYTVKGVDKEGKPLVYIKFGEWDVRRSVVSGQLNRAMRYIDKMLDDGYRAVVKLQEQGKNATQYVLILDLEDYNVVQQGCISCMPLFLYYVQTLQTHFPWTNDKAILINAPTVFELVMRVVRPILSQQVRDGTVTFGTNREEWQRYLRTIIDPSELLKEYGGKLENDDEELNNTR